MKTIKVIKDKIKIDKNKIDLLAISNTLFAECTINESDDDYVFVFNTDGLHDMKQLKKETLANRMIFLDNCAGLESLNESYSFSMDLDNIMYDNNYFPKILLRDEQTDADKSLFLKQYKALSGALITDKHSFMDYMESGDDLYRDSKQTGKIGDAVTIEELKGYLRSSSDELRTYDRKNNSVINKKALVVIKCLLPILAVSTIVLAALLMHSRFLEIPYKNRLVDAGNYYLSSDYIRVEDTLSPIDIKKMPTMTKYVLARSYISTAGLTDTQRENLLSSTGIETDQKIFEYWIYLGRNNYDMAVDIAKQVNDEELLLYAYINQSAYLKSDTSISGEEKESQVSRIDEEIKKMSESIAEEKETMEETTKAELETDILESTSVSDMQESTGEDIDGIDVIN